MKAVHYFDGAWHEGNPAIMGPMSHGFWMASTVFDGARTFEGVSPDLDLHCQRVIRSAEIMGLAPTVNAEEIEVMAREAVGRFGPEAELYIRPMFWAEEGFVAADPESTRFCLSVYESPLPEVRGVSVALSRFRRPTPETMPTEAKAACLYPNNGRALAEARAKGYDNAVVLDMLGNVAELATANIWIVKDGAAITPAPNGCFLNGITKQRVARLLAESGVPVLETRITPEDLRTADEIFLTGNYAKALPIVRFEDRDLQPGPIAAKARKLYWDWALG